MHSKDCVSKLSLRKTSCLSSQLTARRQVDFAGLLTQLQLPPNISTMAMTQKLIDALHMALALAAASLQTRFQSVKESSVVAWSSW